MIRVALLSQWHVHAPQYARQALALGLQISVVWDEDAARGADWARSLGVPFEAALSQALARPDVDAVIVDAPTNRHAEIILAAVNAGKHVFTEKVLALTVADCRQIAKAVESAGVKFCISFPHRTMPHNLFAKQMVDEKALGRVTLLRVRNAHNGASAGWLPPHFYREDQCGGGAMIDLGAHPMYLARWLLGAPWRVSSTFTSVLGKGVEDNAVSVLEFAGGAIAIVETGFVSSHSPFALELYGTEGTLLIGAPDNRVSVFSDRVAGPVPGWVTPAALPKALPSAMEQWVGAIKDGTPVAFGLTEAIELTELMEKAYQSSKEGRQVSF
jgi:predicted dehydrogenase